MSNTKATIHWGIIGDFGESEEVVMSDLSQLKLELNKRIVLKEAEGFAMIPIEEHYTVVISFSLDSWGTAKDLERREELRHIITECLGWIGNGRCDDGDIGNYEMNLYADVVEPYLGVYAIYEAFKEYGIKDEHSFTIMQGDTVVKEKYKLQD